MMASGKGKELRWSLLALFASLPPALFIFNVTGPYPPHPRDWLALPRQAPGPIVHIAAALVAWAIASVLLHRQWRRTRTARGPLIVLALSFAVGALAFSQAFAAAAAYRAGLTPEIAAQEWSAVAVGLFASLLTSAVIVTLGCAMRQLSIALVTRPRG